MESLCGCLSEVSVRALCALSLCWVSVWVSHQSDVWGTLEDNVGLGAGHAGGALLDSTLLLDTSLPAGDGRSLI